MMEKVTFNLTNTQLNQERLMFEASVLKDKNEKLHHDLVMGRNGYAWFYVESMFQGWLLARYCEKNND